MISNFYKAHYLFKMMSLFLVLYSQVVISQTTPVGTLEGIVLDGSNDMALQDAVVKIIELNTYDVTDKNGIFDFKSIPFGNYNIEISFVGYKSNFLSNRFLDLKSYPFISWIKG